MEAMDWPSKLNAIVIEAPRTEKLILLKRTVNTPIAPALYKKKWNAFIKMDFMFVYD